MPPPRPVESEGVDAGGNPSGSSDYSENVHAKAKTYIVVAAGPVESSGLIKLDGTVSADDFHELRLIGKTLPERTVKFEKGGGLIVSGKAGLAVKQARQRRPGNLKRGRRRRD